MRHCEVNKERMASRARTAFLTVTELADTLVRNEDISFRIAHRLVRAAVEAVGNYDEERMVAAVQRLATQEIGRPLRTHVDVLRKALDPQHFVAIRKIAGGPAPEVMAEQLLLLRQQQDKMNSWISLKTRSETQFPQRIEEAKAAILAA
jgi:argininosuccinate lyase